MLWIILQVYSSSGRAQLRDASRYCSNCCSYCEIKTGSGGKLCLFVSDQQLIAFCQTKQGKVASGMNIENACRLVSGVVKPQHRLCIVAFGEKVGAELIADFRARGLSISFMVSLKNSFLFPSRRYMCARMQDASLRASSVVSFSRIASKTGFALRSSFVSPVFRSSLAYMLRIFGGKLSVVLKCLDKNRKITLAVQ